MANDSVDSPCSRNCCLDQEDVCLGCFRTLAEIRDWHSADTAERRAIIRRSQQRKSQHKRNWVQHMEALKR